jgi:predicted MFS family arabinose efflux permease
MPTLALALGWRLALSAVVVVPVIATLATFYIVPRKLEERVETEPSASPGVPKWVHRVALQGLLVGLSVGAMVTYLPLYAQTEIGVSVVRAGAVASAYAVSGFLARLAFPHCGQRARHLAVPMLLLTVIALTGAVLLWASSIFGEGTLWVGAILAGALSGWNALGMLSVIARVEQKSSGAASGVVTRGFGLGVAIGPPVFGTALAATDNFHLGFAIVTAAIVGAALVIASWLRSEHAFAEAAGTGGPVRQALSGKAH